MIRLQGVTLDAPARSGGSPAGSPRLLDTISLSIRSHEYIALVGPNGSGKSLLLHVIAGLRAPSSGEITFDETNTEERPRIGLVLQSPDEQIVGGTVERDLAFGLENEGMDPGEIRRRVDVALASAELVREARRPPHLLSDGEKQRLALASALILEPDLLLLDEPTSCLDPLSRLRFREQIQGRGAPRRSVVHVTHRSEEIVVADRVVGLRAGRMVFDGTPAELVTDAEADGLGILWSPLHSFRRAVGGGAGAAPGVAWNEVPA